MYHYLLVDQGNFMESFGLICIDESENKIFYLVEGKKGTFLNGHVVELFLVSWSQVMFDVCAVEGEVAFSLDRVTVM